MEMCCLSVEMSEATHSSGVSSLVKHLMRKHPKVFEAVTELPPCRDEDNAICLGPGTAPVNVRPYQYPQFQKNEWGKVQMSGQSIRC